MIETVSKFASAIQSSKWYKLQVLLSYDELKNLFSYLENFYIVKTGCLIPKLQNSIDKSIFLDTYKQYIDSLRRGELPDEASSQQTFNSILTSDLNTLCQVYVGSEKKIVQYREPVVQLQHHRFTVGDDFELRSMVFGSQSCSWGLQFSYPHLFQNENYKVFQVNKEVKFVNNHLFKQLKSWLRANSMPTTFITSSGKVFCSPIKIGKSCCGWINMHPQLQQLGLKVKI